MQRLDLKQLTEGEEVLKNLESSARAVPERGIHEELHEGDDRWTNMKISARAAPERDNNNYYDREKESVIGSP